MKGRSETKLDKLEFLVSLTRQRSIQILFGVGFLYLILVTLEIPFVLDTSFSSITQQETRLTRTRLSELEIGEVLVEKSAPTRPLNWVSPRNSVGYPPTQSQLSGRLVSGLGLDPGAFDPNKKDGSVEFQKKAKSAWDKGRKLWEELEGGKVVNFKVDEKKEECPYSVSVSGEEFLRKGKVVEFPCGLNLGSHVTVVGKPRRAHPEEEEPLMKGKGKSVVVSQFILELLGLKTVEGEEPPRVLHFNPRLKGDWSRKPVIEMNTCYRQQWGTAMRCEGWKSKPDEETVDGQKKCEKWIRDDAAADDDDDFDDVDGDFDFSEESNVTWLLDRLMGRTKKVTFDWPFPFVEEMLFVLTLSAGLEGYHVNVDGRHITSFPYHIGFTLEDATGLAVNGDLDVHSVFAASLPTAHPNSTPSRHLEMSDRWRAPPLPRRPVDLFIGVISAGNHFAERMAVRKSWMQHKLIKSSSVVARFFVALHSRNEVNLELKKEAEFFGDVVIVPYMDNYDLVVLKTVAICEYGIRTVPAKYIMKGDDDTFVRVDAVLNEAKNVSDGKSLYIGNINYYHKPLRYGKWAVTNEEWAEEDYPPYANGPGYIISFDIASFVVSEFEQHKLRLFKMEDVSMGIWVQQFNSSKPVIYTHSLKFCQSGCFNGYYTAHYQSPRQMICLWTKLRVLGKSKCCNMR